MILLHHKNLNEDRTHMLSAAKNVAPWRYKVYADIHGGSLGRGRETTVGLSTTAIFNVFAGYFSDTLEMRPALLYGDM